YGYSFSDLDKVLEETFRDVSFKAVKNGKFLVTKKLPPYYIACPPEEKYNKPSDVSGTITLEEIIYVGKGNEIGLEEYKEEDLRNRILTFDIRLKDIKD